MLKEWESIVNRVAQTELGDKMIICGRAARWWDNEIKIEQSTVEAIFMTPGVI